MQNTKTAQLTCGGIIAAVYVLLTALCGVLGIGYGPIQLRISEALCVLPVFTPAAVPGLAVGCLVANLFSFNPVDIAVGTFATLLSALLTRRLRHIKTAGLPIVSLLPPVIINAVFVGAETALVFFKKAIFWQAFAICGLSVMLGQALSCFALGIPLYLFVKKLNLFK